MTTERRLRWVACLAVLAVLSGLTVMEFRGPRPASVPAGIQARSTNAASLKVERRLQVPAASTWATDGDLAVANEPLFGITPSTSSVRVDENSIAGRRAVTVTHRARTSKLSGNVRYDVTRWNQRSASYDLAEIGLRDDRIRTRLVSLNGRSTVRAVGTAHVPRAGRSADRQVVVVRTRDGASSRPDVMVFDRAAKAVDVEVSLISGASGYTQVTRRFTAPLVSDPRYWSIDVAKVFPKTSASPLSDATLAAIAYVVGQPGRSFEIHPASAANDFSGFVGERTSELTKTAGLDAAALTGQVDWTPVAYVVWETRGRAQVAIVQTVFPRKGEALANLGP